MRKGLLLSLLIVFPALAHASIFGEETAVLLQVVANQVTELNKLAEQIGVSKENRDLMQQLNEGIGKATQQIRSIQEIVERAQGLDPLAIRSLSELNEAIAAVKGLSHDTAEILSLKLHLCDEATSESAVQAETAYKMGQEMISTGGDLSRESKDASPGRANQISASAASAQMLASGVQLQTLAQIAQLQAQMLDLQKSQLEQQLKNERLQRFQMSLELASKPKSREGKRRPN